MRKREKNEENINLLREGVEAVWDDVPVARLNMRPLAVGMRGYGRIIWFDPSPDGLMPAGQPPGDGDVLFGYVSVPERIWERAWFAHLLKRAEDAPLYESAVRHMRERSTRELNEMLDFCSFVCDHIAPVLLYAEEETYTNFYEYNNLLEGGNSRGALFSRLAKTPLSGWTRRETWFVYSLYYLLKSGPPARGEEFNGCQLNPAALREFFLRKFAEYGDGSPEVAAEAEAFYAADIPEQAEMLRRFRARVADRRLFFRDINGLNLLKKEVSMPKNAVCVDNSDALPGELRRCLSARCGLDVANFGEFHTAVREWISRSVARHRPDTEDDGVLRPLEELVYAIVRTAVLDLDSDIGMSRSIRDYAAFVRAVRDGRFRDLCALKQTDYFCCVVPSPNIARAMQDRSETLAGVLKAIAMRMQYNSWHYLPGNFPAETVPPDRHFYFPPEMPDMAEWSDQHHKGHILASVRYSIRSPHHVSLDGKKFLAFFDLRLMRQSGRPYTTAELMEAIRYTRALYAVYQTLLDEAAAGALPFRFEAFTKEWYDRNVGLTLLFEEDSYVL
ncbi:MAG: hypothetical protein BLM47_13600 [Candidatus Reconcilbacillus cellulovorans]|uniref:Uncharacterized protein n=1 Tax=Candidatus Reconcilbacillus cellulovorans TaxID=1906605 RepID=A0A2A6DWU3_9BACL|nr:MAG: hypothetical protein BLM47_13600 [Candidatus Reconcilbacillus cellulovorans]